MKNNSFILFLLVFIANTSYSQSFEWGLTRPDGQIYRYPLFIQSLENNDLLFAGEFGYPDSLDIDPGISNRYVHQNELFLQRFSENKNLIWTTIVKGSSFGYRSCEYISDEDVIRIFAFFNGWISVEDNSGTQTITSTGPECIILTLNLNGELLSSTKFELPDTPQLNDIDYASEINNSVFVFEYEDSIKINLNNQTQQFTSPNQGLLVVNVGENDSIQNVYNLTTEYFTINSVERLGQNTFLCLSHIGPISFNGNVISSSNSSTGEVLLKIDQNGTANVIFSSPSTHYLFKKIDAIDDRFYITGVLNGSYNFGSQSNPYLISTDSLELYYLVLDSNFQPINHIITQNPNVQFIEHRADHINILNPLYQSKDLDPGTSIDMVNVNPGDKHIAISLFSKDLDYISSNSYQDSDVSGVRQFSMNDNFQFYVSGTVSAYSADVAPGIDTFYVVYEDFGLDDGSGGYIMKLNMLEAPTAIKSIDSEHDVIKIYPNPSSTAFNIALDQPYETAEIKLFDISGKQVYTKSFSSNSIIVINPSLSPGVYFGSVTTEKGTQVLKLIRE